MPVDVLHVCDKFGVRGSSIHGVSRLFSWWLPRYDRSRFTVGLVGLKRPEPATRWLAEQGITVRHLGRGRFDPRILLDLVALVRERKTRILHVHGYAASDFGRLAARLSGARLVLHEHFADPRMPAYQRLADRLLSSFTDHAIAVSHSTREFLVSKRFVPQSRVSLVWNGAPLDDFAPAGRDRARKVRRELGLPPEATVVGTIGRLNAQKGHRFLLDAAAPLCRRHADLRVLIVGDGDLMEDLQTQADRLGLTERVVLAGHRTDVPDLLAALDVFCISSLYEGTPLALFEAMAAGRAIVSTAVDGCREILEDGTTALLVPPADAAALERALERVLVDPSLREKLGQRAHEASRMYDVGSCVEQMEAIYDSLLDTKGVA